MRITAFSVLMVFLHIAMVLLFGLTTDYAEVPFRVTSNLVFAITDSGTYANFIDLHVLVFFSLGIMMSVVYRNSFTAAGMSLLLAATSSLLSMLNYAFWQQAVLSPSSWSRLLIGRDVLVHGDYTAAAVLVTFGALLGRVSAAQALLVAFWEVIVYNILVAIGSKNFQITDTGGSTHIFFFATVYGLVASAVLARLSNRTGDTILSFATQPSSTTAALGTLFAWCFWPSFNAYTATSDLRESYAVVNTYLALCASTILSVATTRLVFDGKDHARTSLYATLSGGVAMGTASTMLVRPFGAILIGGFAGIVSVLSFRFLQPVLVRVRVPDTIGILSWFGIPGLIGAIVGMITTAAYRPSEYSRYVNSTMKNWPLVASGMRGSSEQGSYQLAYLVLALGLALVSGVIGGFLAWFAPALETTYNDAEEWVVEADTMLMDDGKDTELTAQ